MNKQLQTDWNSSGKALDYKEIWDPFGTQTVGSISPSLSPIYPNGCTNLQSLHQGMRNPFSPHLPHYLFPLDCLKIAIQLAWADFSLKFLFYFFWQLGSMMPRRSLKEKGLTPHKKSSLPWTPAAFATKDPTLSLPVLNAADTTAWRPGWGCHCRETCPRGPELLLSPFRTPTNPDFAAPCRSARAPTALRLIPWVLGDSFDSPSSWEPH